MHYSPTPDERELRAALRQLLDHSASSAAYEVACGSEDGFDPELWSELASSGWLDVHSLGQDDAGVSAWPIVGVQLAEELGRHPVTAPIELVVGFLVPVLDSLAPGSLGISSTDELAEVVPAVWLEPARALLGIGSGTVPEISVQEDADGSLVLSGVLPTVQFAASADALFLPLRLRTGWSLIRVDLDAQGVRTEVVRTVDPGRTCARVRLANVSVPAAMVARSTATDAPLDDALLDAYLAYLLMLDGKAVGAAEVLLERTVTYVSERKQFGVPIGSFQAVKHMVAEMATGMESARSMAAYTAWQVAEGHDDRVEAVLASRLHSADVYRRLVERAIQCHGGMGFTAEVGLQVWYQSASFDSAITGITTSDLGQLLARTA